MQIAPEKNFFSSSYSISITIDAHQDNGALFFNSTRRHMQINTYMLMFV